MGGRGAIGSQSGIKKKKEWKWKSPHHFQFILFLPYCPADHREYSPNQIYDLSHLNSADFPKRRREMWAGEIGVGEEGDRSAIYNLQKKDTKWVTSI